MVLYSDEMATSTSVATTYAAMTGSPYNPLTNGRLIKVELHAAGDAATSLIEMVVVKLTNPKWGVPLIVSTQGGGLRTATCPPIPTGEIVCDLPVTIGSQITIEIKNETGATPVTPRYSVIGLFQG